MINLKGTSNVGITKDPDLSGVVPKRLNDMTSIDEMTTDKTKACMYVDDNGTDKKITMEDFTASIISALPRYAGRIE